MNAFFLSKTSILLLPDNTHTRHGQSNKKHKTIANLIRGRPRIGFVHIEFVTVAVTTVSISTAAVVWTGDGIREPAPAR